MLPIENKDLQMQEFKVWIVNIGIECRIQIGGFLVGLGSRVCLFQTGAGHVEDNLFSQKNHVGLVGQEAQHHEIPILSHNAVSKVGIVIWCFSLLPQELHDFVLSLSRDVGTAENDCELFPLWIRREFVLDKVFEVFCKFCKEGSPGGDFVRVKSCVGVLTGGRRRRRQQRRR